MSSWDNFLTYASDEAWKKAVPFLRLALERGAGTHSETDILAGLRSGKMQLWLGEDSAAVTSLHQHPNSKVCLVFLAGGSLTELVEIEAAIAAWARVLSCNQMQIAGRAGWERALDGYEKKFVVLVKEI